MILDHQLDFQSHIREVILKARRGIGLIKYLSKYVSREVIDQAYKLYMRPHLDYGDIIYHRFDPESRQYMYHLICLDEYFHLIYNLSIGL